MNANKLTEAQLETISRPTFCEVICISDDRDEWLKARRKGFGASEAASIMGCGFQTPLELWAHKVGAVPEPDLGKLEHVHFGNVLESTIAEQYATERYAGRPVTRSAELLRSNSYPWAQATLDYWTIHPEHGAIPLEIKTATEFRSEDWAEGPPEKYVWQVQHQMFVTGTRCASIACLIGGRQLVWCDVTRDEFMIEREIEAATILWQRVKDGNPPPPDGSPAARTILNALYPTDDPDKEITLGHEFIALDVRLEEAKEAENTARSAKAEAENLIWAEMEDAQIAWLPDGTKFTLKTQERKEHVVKASSFRVLRRKAPKEA